MVFSIKDTYKTKLWIKHLFDKQKRVGSNPVSPANKIKWRDGEII